MPALYTQCVRLVTCPKCKAKPGDKCVMPSGRKTWPPHNQRIVELLNTNPAAVEACVIKQQSLDVILGGIKLEAKTTKP